MQFSYYKIVNSIAPCDAVRCGALLLAVRCGYAILRVVLVWFLWFMQFVEHPYPRAHAVRCSCARMF